MSASSRADAVHDSVYAQVWSSIYTSASPTRKWPPFDKRAVDAEIERIASEYASHAARLAREEFTKSEGTRR